MGEQKVRPIKVVKDYLKHSVVASPKGAAVSSFNVRDCFLASLLAMTGTLFVPGCSLKSLALKSTAGLLEKGTQAFYEEADVQFAKESMPGQLKFLEALLQNDPLNKKILLNLAQGFGGYAFLFLEDQDPDRAKVFYQRGRDYGLRILGKKSGNLKLVHAGDVPALFWTSYCWGAWANLSRNDPQALGDLPKVEAMMRKVSELSPGYFYGGPEIFLGAYYGSRPKMFGGSLEKSKMYFEKALKASNGTFLMADVFYAQHHAVPAQDREEFAALLGKVLNASGDVLPEQRLSNAVAKEKAKKMMEKIDELF